MVENEATYTASVASSVSGDGQNQETSPAPDPQPSSGPKRRDRAQFNFLTQIASRAGTRCVSTLTEAQLSRKRANDREAQRAIRQRNKDHIESLEHRIQELSKENVDAAELYEVRQRNLALEEEVRLLKESLAEATRVSTSGADWLPTAGYSSQPSMLPSYGSSRGILPVMNSQDPARRATHSFSGSSTSSHLGNIVEDHHQFESTLSSDAKDFGLHDDSISNTNWVGTAAQQNPNLPFVGMGSQYVNQISGYQQPDSAPHGMPSLFVKQPFVHFYELPIRFFPPRGAMDNFLVSIVRDQRMIGADGSPGNKMIGPPSLRKLIDVGSFPKATPEPVSDGLSKIITASSARRLPEKVALLFMGHLLLRWQIYPVLSTYNDLPVWYKPLELQLFEPHDIWASYIHWPRLREKILQNKQLYAKEEFLDSYFESINLNWPYHDIDVLTFEGRNVRISPAFERHILNGENWSLDLPFAQKYPELQECCRYTGYREEVC